MISDKNRTETDQNNQGNSEEVSAPQPSTYRPNWIIPDSTQSSTERSRSANQNNTQDNNPSVPLGDDETLGIP